jgi:hypothetical protein
VNGHTNWGPSSIGEIESECNVITVMFRILLSWFMMDKVLHKGPSITLC